jgi:hypothetical protein
MAMRTLGQNSSILGVMGSRRRSRGRRKKCGKQGRRRRVGKRRRKRSIGVGGLGAGMMTMMSTCSAVTRMMASAVLCCAVSAEGVHAYSSMLMRMCVVVGEGIAVGVAPAWGYGVRVGFVRAGLAGVCAGEACLTAARCLEAGLHNVRWVVGSVALAAWC